MSMVQPCCSLVIVLKRRESLQELSPSDTTLGYRATKPMLELIKKFYEGVKIRRRLIKIFVCKCFESTTARQVTLAPW
jgi:hypothetical protein